jgi:transcriptional regulator with XRE-family HTH domain
MLDKLGAILRDMRIRRGLTGDDFGAAIGTDKSNVSRYESGSPMTVKRLIKAAEVLGVSLSDLFAAAEGKKAPVVRTPFQADLDLVESHLPEEAEQFKQQIQSEAAKIRRILEGPPTSKRQRTGTR